MIESLLEHELLLSVRATNVCQQLGIRTIRDLIEKTPAEIFAVKQCGWTTLNEIRQELLKLGLFLKNDPMC